MSEGMLAAKFFRWSSCTIERARSVSSLTVGWRLHDLSTRFSVSRLHHSSKTVAKIKKFVQQKTNSFYLYNRSRLRIFSQRSRYASFTDAFHYYKIFPPFKNNEIE